MLKRGQWDGLANEGICVQTWRSMLEPTWQKERSDVIKLSFVLHTCAIAHLTPTMYIYQHTYANKYKWKFRIKFKKCAGECVFSLLKMSIFELHFKVLGFIEGFKGIPYLCVFYVLLKISETCYREITQIIYIFRPFSQYVWGVLYCLLAVWWAAVKGCTQCKRAVIFYDSALKSSLVSSFNFSTILNVGSCNMCYVKMQTSFYFYLIQKACQWEKVIVILNRRHRIFIE